MVQIKLNSGIIEGEKLDNESCGSYYSFKGIPYAEPPLGDLRFQAPKPVKPWSSVRSAKSFGPVCTQFDLILTRTFIPGSEDCLYLNVYSPDIKPQELLPVMVWIHGGGFIGGSGNDDIYGPEYLIKRDVVLVTINYRVGALGFLCLDTEEIPGNAGMKDQVAALKWVQDNIKKFGGNPDNVTIFGQSAGAACISYHLVSPMSKGLFKRAIIQSGVSLNTWGETTDARKRALVLAKTLGCYSEDDKELAQFFKSQPAASLLVLHLPLTFLEDGRQYPEMYFSVVSEKTFDNIERFYSGDHFDNIRTNIHERVDVIVGYMEYEGVSVAGFLPDFPKAIKQANTNLEYFVPKSIYLNNTPHKSHEIGLKIKEFYLGKQHVNDSNKDKFIKYLSTSFFSYDIVKWAKIAASSERNNILFYKVTCESERNVFGSILCGPEININKSVPAHGDDLLYLFSNNICIKKVKTDSKEHHMIKNITKLWTNFAKYGDPTADDSLKVTWPKFTMEEQDYLDIGEELVPRKCPDKEEIEFWDNIFKEYYPKRYVGKF